MQMAVVFDIELMSVAATSLLTHVLNRTFLNTCCRLWQSDHFCHHCCGGSCSDCYSQRRQCNAQLQRKNNNLEQNRVQMQKQTAAIQQEKQRIVFMLVLSTFCATPQ